MIVRSRCIAALTAVVALSSVASASAVTKSNVSAKSSRSDTKVAKTMSASKARGSGVVKPVQTAGTSVAQISAFPTGGKGSGTEATCGLWSDRLQEDQNTQDDATDKQDVIDATETLNSDINNALDAGCAVIY
jgi:hypothetical protein